MIIPDLTLYCITDSTDINCEQLCQRVDMACKGGATLIQLREKDRSTREYIYLADAVKTVTDKYKIPLIIDDRVDVALAVDAAGVHVGAEDMPVSLARKILGNDKIVGATAKTLETALNAEEEGASYLGTGAIYPTVTHVKTRITKVSTLKEICSAVDIPVCAIGGLNKRNCDVLKNTGLSGIAVVSAVMKAENPQKEAEILKNIALKLIARD
ncbi:MAG: thiamine phosphate synthase [Oscillospiraceae bacterium]